MSKFQTVGVVEDNPASVYWIKEIMEEVNFADKILVFKNGKIAIDEITALMQNKQETPDLIFLDLNLPVMDGWEFLEEFTKLSSTKEIPVYILTSSVDPDDLIKVKRYERVKGYIVKPITEPELKKILNAVE